MYLSRVILNVRSRAVRYWLADVNALHRDVLLMFAQAPESDSARASLGVLYRLDQQRDGRLVLIVQSQQPAAFQRLPPDAIATPDLLSDVAETPQSKRIDEQLAALHQGQILRFRLRANPTKKVDTKTGPDGKRRNGRRLALRSESERLAWLRRKAEQHGFELGDVDLSSDLSDVIDVSEGHLRGQRRNEEPKHSQMTFGSCVFEGTLRITRIEEFRAAVTNGIGSAKAFGFGLLSIAPAM